MGEANILAVVVVSSAKNTAILQKFIVSNFLFIVKRFGDVEVITLHNSWTIRNMETENGLMKMGF